MIKITHHIITPQSEEEESKGYNTYWIQFPNQCFLVSVFDADGKELHRESGDDLTSIQGNYEKFIKNLGASISSHEIKSDDTTRKFISEQERPNISSSTNELIERLRNDKK